MTQSPPPAGWYEEDARPGMERWWSGSAWGPIRPQVECDSVAGDDPGFDFAELDRRFFRFGRPTRLGWILLFAALVAAVLLATTAINAHRPADADSVARGREAGRNQRALLDAYLPEEVSAKTRLDVEETCTKSYLLESAHVADENAYENACVEEWFSAE